MVQPVKKRKHGRGKQAGRAGRLQAEDFMETATLLQRLQLINRRRLLARDLDTTRVVFLADMDELFDVFDEKAARPKKEKKNRKRSANGDIKSQKEEKSQQNGGASIPQPDGEEAPAPENGQAERDQKRQRKDGEPEPVVTDTFETEQSREVAASAGLQASKDDKAVVLSHQVRHQVSLPPDYEYGSLDLHGP